MIAGRRTGSTRPAADVAEFLGRALPEAYRYASRLAGGDRDVADELVQEACLALLRHSQSSDEIVDVGWMLVVIRRRYIDGIRRRDRVRDRLSRSLPREPTVEPDWDSIEGGRALKLLGGLTPLQRGALVLRYVDDLPVAAVGRALRRSVPATESLLARARRELARLVLKESGDD